MLLLVFAIFSSAALAQPANFSFTGYIVFTDGTDTHIQNFEDWGPYGQNAPIPGYVALEGNAAPLFHLSCSEDLTGFEAEVSYAHWAGFTNPENSGFSDPAGFFGDGDIVFISDFYIERQGPGQGTPICRPERPEISKSADGTYDQTYDWQIDKSVTPSAVDIFFGDSHEFDYTVDVDTDGVVNINHAVSGIISLRNTLPDDITVTAITDSFTGGSDIVIECTPELPVLLSQAVDLTPQIVCDYSGTSNGTPGTNTALATYTRHDPVNGDIPGLVVPAQADFDFSGDPGQIFNPSVGVQDVFDGGAVEVLGNCDLGSAPCQWNYTRTLDCADVGVTVSGNSGMKSNTASIPATGDEDSESVTVTCHALDVTKIADPEFTREYFWVVNKVLNDDDPVEVMEGQSYELDYSVFVGLDEPAYEDSNWSLSGDITVTNLAPGISATINSLSDVFSGGTGTVDCGSDAPWVIPGGGTLDCTYSGDSDGTTPGTNTATATQQNYAYDSAGDGAPNGTTDYQGSAPFDMDDPTSSVNACVDVWDVLTIDNVFEEDELLMLEGALENDPSLCYYDAPAEFSYTYEKLWFPIGSKDLDEPFCEILVDNEAFVFPYVAPEELVVADLPEGEWLAYDIVSALLENAECNFGCTLTQGYWKTHSEYGPAPYDETWAQLANGADTPFFLSGDSWINVFWTPPKGNAYYNLAHQWMAATLNVINEASTTPEVDSALSAAESVFAICEPGEFEKARGKKRPGGSGSCGGADAGDLKNWARILDEYNNGEIGPGHCSENEVEDNNLD